MNFKYQLLLALWVSLTAAEQGLALDFSYDNMTHARMKLSKSFDYEAYADAYMQMFRPVVYKTYRNDEFKLREKRLETVEVMKRATENFSLDEEFVLKTNLHVGAYDFQAKRFQIQEVVRGYYWNTNRRSYVPDLPIKYSVFFRNPDLIRSLPMSERAASTFIDGRKDRYGNVNRRIYAEIKFKIAKLKNGKNEFYVDVQSANFYDDKHWVRLLHHVELPKPKKEIVEDLATKAEVLPEAIGVL